MLNLFSKQTQERLTKISLITSEEKSLQDLENSSNLLGFVIDIFSENIIA
jgi:hypothetical protein